MAGIVRSLSLAGAGDAQDEDGDATDTRSGATEISAWFERAPGAAPNAILGDIPDRDAHSNRLPDIGQRWTNRNRGAAKAAGVEGPP